MNNSQRILWQRGLLNKKKLVPFTITPLVIKTKSIEYNMVTGIAIRYEYVELVSAFNHRFTYCILTYKMGLIINRFVTLFVTRIRSFLRITFEQVSTILWH